MLDILILFILIMGTVIGYRRGFILQSLHLIGTIGAFIIARMFYLPLANKLTLLIPFPSANTSHDSSFLNLVTNEHTFYNLISFIILFVFSKMILQIIGTVFDYIAQIPILKQMNMGLGLLLGFIECYLGLFLFLFLLAMLPISFIETHINKSNLANIIVNHTPFLSGIIKSWWLH